MAYEGILDTPSLDRIEKFGKDHEMKHLCKQIAAARPGIAQRRKILFDLVNDPRVDGQIPKKIITCGLFGSC